MLNFCEQNKLHDEKDEESGAVEEERRETEELTEGVEKGKVEEVTAAGESLLKLDFNQIMKFGALGISPPV